MCVGGKQSISKYVKSIITNIKDPKMSSISQTASRLNQLLERMSQYMVTKKKMKRDEETGGLRTRRRSNIHLIRSPKGRQTNKTVRI